VIRFFNPLNFLYQTSPSRLLIAAVLIKFELLGNKFALSPTFENYILTGDNGTAESLFFGDITPVIHAESGRLGGGTVKSSNYLNEVLQQQKLKLAYSVEQQLEAKAEIKNGENEGLDGRSLFL
jgi:hypothetical protein